MTTHFIVPSRNPVGRTPTGWHEDTHQINSELRNKYGIKYNAMYKGNREAFLLLEPKLTLTDVAINIPTVLQGMSYRLYLEQQARWWNDRPLYVLDELSAYLSGSRHPASEWSDYLQSFEFTAYSYYLLNIVPHDYIDYNNLKTAIMWATEDAYKYKDHPRVIPYRQLIKQYLGDFRFHFPSGWVNKYFY